jgi:hypothetical protein
MTKFYLLSDNSAMHIRRGAIEQPTQHSEFINCVSRHGLFYKSVEFAHFSIDLTEFLNFFKMWILNGRCLSGRTLRVGVNCEKTAFFTQDGES